MIKKAANEEISLKEMVMAVINWVRYFRENWKLILVLGILGSVIGFAIAYFDKPIYTAELTLALEEKSGGAGNYAGIASQFGIDIGGKDGGVFSGENNLELLKSRYIIETSLLTPVIINGKRDLLVNRYIEFNEYKKKWKNKPGLEDIFFLENEPRKQYSIIKDSVLFILYKRIKKDQLIISKLNQKLSIISVVVKSQDELFAKLFAEVIVQTASNFYIETKTKKSRSNLNILEARIDSVKHELDKGIYGVAVSKDRNLNTIRAEAGIQSAKKQLNVQVLTAMYAELTKNIEIAKYTLMREEPLIQIIDTPILPLEKAKMSKLIYLIIGGFVGGLSSLLYLTFVRIKKEVMN
jgi:hypothetical protein